MSTITGAFFGAAPPLHPRFTQPRTSPPPHMAEHKYRVIKRLEAGGMAEVFVGEAVSVQGFKKQVAIKRVLPHLAQNPDFIEMFLDEARLSAKLTHANIVSVFDISAREDTYFLVMEFVDGANLKKIIENVSARNKSIPLAQATFICIEACRGLSYAHELTGENGEPLGIVHRDISPPNIMVTKRGEVKVADFGLAKAGTQLSQTDPGVVKGKFSYLSPEAALGEEVDARTDVFSLGIVLWEMLAGRRLFLGESDYATVKLVQKANIPRLATLNREIDEEFEEVLLRALTQDPNQRYKSAREFGDALAGYLYGRQLKVTSYDLATLVQDVTDTPTASGPGTGSGVSQVEEGSLIGRLIEEELDESVGIDKPQEDTGGSFLEEGMPGEDPRSWFDEDDLARLSSRPMGPAPDEAESPSGSWREPKVHIPAAAPTPQEADSAEHPAAQAAQAAEPGAPPPTPPPAEAADATASEGSGGAGKIVVFAVVALALAAAAAWFSTQM